MTDGYFKLKLHSLQLDKIIPTAQILFLNTILY